MANNKGERLLLESGKYVAYLDNDSHQIAVGPLTTDDVRIFSESLGGRIVLEKEAIDWIDFCPECRRLRQVAFEAMEEADFSPDEIREALNLVYTA